MCHTPHATAPITRLPDQQITRSKEAGRKDFLKPAPRGAVQDGYLPPLPDGVVEA